MVLLHCTLAGSHALTQDANIVRGSLHAFACYMQGHHSHVESQSNVNSVRTGLCSDCATPKSLPIGNTHIHVGNLPMEKGTAMERATGAGTAGEREKEREKERERDWEMALEREMDLGRAAGMGLDLVTGLVMELGWDWGWGWG